MQSERVTLVTRNRSLSAAVRVGSSMRHHSMAVLRGSRARGHTEQRGITVSL